MFKQLFTTMKAKTKELREKFIKKEVPKSVVPKEKFEPKLRKENYETMKRVRFHRHSKLPMSAELFYSVQGYLWKQPGHTNLSGPCPTPEGATRTALKNLARL